MCLGCMQIPCHCQFMEQICASVDFLEGEGHETNLPLIPRDECRENVFKKRVS